MGGKDSNCSVVYRGETLEYFKEGEWLFFQRSKESGGGFWFGRTFSDCFWLEFERPTSLREGLLYLLALESMKARVGEFDDDFKLE
jgi:hypothetical protein